MSTTYQSPEFAPKRPEIKGGAALEAEDRVRTIGRAVEYVLAATDGIELPDSTHESVPESFTSTQITTDPRMDAALAAVEAAHRSVHPETGVASVGA